MSNRKTTKAATEKDLLVDRDLLKIARSIIQTRQQRFVCHALYDAVVTLRANLETAQGKAAYSLLGSEEDLYFRSRRLELTGWIGHLLRIQRVSESGRVYYARADYLDTWMRHFHPELVCDLHLTDTQYAAKMCQARVAWIDWMIGEVNREIELVKSRAVDAAVPSTARNRRRADAAAS